MFREGISTQQSLYYTTPTSAGLAICVIKTPSMWKVALCVCTDTLRQRQKCTRISKLVTIFRNVFYVGTNDGLQSLAEQTRHPIMRLLFVVVCTTHGYIRLLSATLSQRVSRLLFMHLSLFTLSVPSPPNPPLLCDGIRC